MMSSAANLDVPSNTLPRDYANIRKLWVGSVLFAVLLAAKAIAFLLLGTGQRGLAVVLSILVLDSLLAIACAWAAFRRAHGIAAMFWFLFIVNLVVLLVPTVLQAYDTALGVTTLPDPERNLLYCLYGVPILMMLFLPDSYARERVKSEIFLDLFQIAIVVGLIYSTFFFLPLQSMLPAEALRHNVNISDELSFLLLIAAVLRFHFARIPSSRDLLRRLVLFLFVCAVATFVGDWIDFKHYVVADAWFNLGWAIPQVAAGLLALTWRPSPESTSTSEPANFLSFLGSNLVLVAMLSCVALFTDRWKQAYGVLLANAAIAASLVAFTFRLALTQFHQQQEIAERKASQQNLIAANDQVSLLLNDARRQTDEITQISELGSLLEACASKEEVFRLIPERLRRLFPSASGCVALLSPSKNRAESVAEWGPCPPADQIFVPHECWALRRGCMHAHPRGVSASRCSHLTGHGASVCLPLIANGEAIGTVAIQNHEDCSSHPYESEAESNTFARRCQLAAAVAEHLAFAIANLDLREALRLQAVRDPLTGLYNRRHMQEFLEHEIHRARRRRRSVAVMMLDLDHFKRYNDTYGHSAGDQILRMVGETLLSSVRSEDLACRYGGEEFVIMLPECSLLQAVVRGDEIRKRLKELPVERSGEFREPITVSIGVAAFEETTDKMDILLKCADEALYQAKRDGRDRVVAACPVPRSGT
jgi:diguanylate cyclase (GGDEF)-like protein